MASNIGDLTGQTLGTCTLISLLGQGGMGTVYLARQARPSRNVAVKVLLPNLAMNSQIYQAFLERFRREADVIARLEHVNIMPIYEYGEENELAYLVMPNLTGGSLRDSLIKRGKLSLTEVIQYTDQAASALDYAHSQGVIHRDLKPANFLLHADGRLVLADFGIARMIETDSTSGSTLTSTGVILGTPEYMAPEMVNGQQIDYRADIYELGIVIFHLLSGCVPFTGNTPFAVATRHVQEPLPSLHQLNPAVPVAVDIVLQKATAKHPADRYQSVQALAQALRRASTAPTTYTGNYQGNTNSSFQNGQMILPTPPPQYYHSLPAQQYTVSANSFDTRGSNPAYLQQTPLPYIPHPSSIQSPVKKLHASWGLLIGIFAVFLLIVASIFAAAQFMSKGYSPAQTNAPATIQSTQADTPAATSTQQSTQTDPLVAFPNTSPLYTALAPGCDKKKSGWNALKVDIHCEIVRTTINNNAEQSGGLFLTRIASQGNYPTNYAIKVRLQTEKTTRASYGIAFRSTQAGGYVFLIQPDGSWNIYASSNAGIVRITGGQNAVEQQSTIVTLAIAAKGSQFSFYANDKFLGNATDLTYPSGILGIIVDHNSTIVANNFDLYSFSAPSNSGEGNNN